MKIIFVGSVIFSEYILDNLIKNKIKFSGIIALNNSKKKFKSDYKDLSILAKSSKIPNIKIDSINSKKSLNFIKSINPDIIFCLGWSEILSEEILSLPKISVIGYHPSKLPLNRGKHPIIWSIALGLKNTASTFFLMDRKVDNGKIISQKILQIKNNDNATTIYKKLSKIALIQIKEIIKNIYNNKLVLKNQNHRNSNYWRSRNYLDGQINWSSSSKTIHNLVRSLTWPYPNAHFLFNNKEIKVLKTSLGKNKDLNIEYGKIISQKNGIYEIKCGIASIHLDVINPNIKLKVGSYL